MMTRRGVMAAVACCGLGLLAAELAAQEGGAVKAGGAGAATGTRPKVEVDLKDPQAALKTYLLAQQAMDYKTIKDMTAVSDAAKKPLVDIYINYNLWTLYLERQASVKFGPGEGLKVFSHVRSLDDQLVLDLKRVREPSVDYGVNRETATVYLRVERNRPEELKIDRFSYLDAYHFIKQADGWKLDYLKTYECNDAEKESQYQFEAGVFPKMIKAMKALAEEIKSGKFRDAEMVHSAMDTKWKEAYGEDKVPEDKPADGQ